MSRRTENILSAIQTLTTINNNTPKVIVTSKINKSIRLLRDTIDRHIKFSTEEIGVVMECMLDALSDKRSIYAAIRHTARRLDLTQQTVQYLWYKHKTVYLGANDGR